MDSELINTICGYYTNNLKDKYLDNVLHIGLHKTGSTFLQFEVFPKIKTVNIISNECFTGNPIYSFNTVNRYIILKGVLETFGNNCKVILGIREPESWLKSCYNQYVKSQGSGFHSYKYWLNHIFNVDLLDFSRLIDFLENNFKGVYVYKFEELCKNKDKIVGEICDFCDSPMINYNNNSYNKKLNTGELYLFRSINFVKEGYKVLFKRGY